MSIVAAAVAAVAAIAWLFLAVGRAFFWRTDQRLPDASAPPGPWPDVVVIVPARDEAAVLPRTLPTLLAQDYPGDLRIVVVDDASTDGTAGFVRDLASGAARPLAVVDAGPRPDGWAGKVWAMARGVDAAADAPYLLFTDADIAHHAGSVRALVVAAGTRDGGRDLVGQMVRLRTHTGWEKLVIPAFVWFFAMLYPFRRVNRPGARTAASAGGCQLVRAQALRDAGGLPAIRGALIDDVALGALLKRAGGRIWLGLAPDVESVRPYPRLADLWSMIARGAFTQLRYSWLAVLGTVVGLAWLFAVPPLATFGGAVALAVGASPTGAALALLVAGAVAWALMSALYLPITRFYRLAPWRVLTLPGVALLYAAMTFDSALRHARGTGGAWKGRTTSA